MKKITLNFALLLATLVGILSSCSKTNVEPEQPQAGAQSSDAVMPPLTYQVKSFMFLRVPGPAQMGHTGVGYFVREMRGTSVVRAYTRYGGVEGYNSFPLLFPGYSNGGWSDVGYNTPQSMLNKMKSPFGYTNYKCELLFRNVSLSQLNQASAILNYFPHRGYQVTTNNCLDATVQVLQALGTPRLPVRLANMAPRLYYLNTTGTNWSGSVTL